MSYNFLNVDSMYLYTVWLCKYYAMSVLCNLREITKKKGAIIVAVVVDVIFVRSN